MLNKDLVETSIMALNDALSNLSAINVEHQDIFAEEIAEINNQIEKMQIKYAHIHCQILNDGKCAVHDYAGHDNMTEVIA